jgi:SPP1 gp7 family putative phage head morphogenesis protein
MPDPVVVQVLREFKEALRLREAAQMTQMAQRYVQIEQRLAGQMELLAQDMAAKKAAGQVVSEGALYRMDRYKALHLQVEAQINNYNSQYALPFIEAEQRYYGEIGIRGAWDALASQAGSAGLNIGWNRLPVEAIEQMVGLAGDGSPLKALLAKAYPAAMDGMIKQLIDSTALGINPRQTARNMADGLGDGLDRVLTIARTEQLRVYRMASTEQYRESGIVKGFKRLATKDTRTCLACLMSDGEMFQVEEELSDHPNGRCTCIPVLNVGPQVQWENGQDWFKALPEERQQALMGEQLFNGWKGHKFGLSDLRKTAHSDTWGDSPRVATFKELELRRTWTTAQRQSFVSRRAAKQAAASLEG